MHVGDWTGAVVVVFVVEVARGLVGENHCGFGGADVVGELGYAVVDVLAGVAMAGFPVVVLFLGVVGDAVGEGGVVGHADVDGFSKFYVAYGGVVFAGIGDIDALGDGDAVAGVGGVDVVAEVEAYFGADLLLHGFMRRG